MSKDFYSYDFVVLWRSVAFTYVILKENVLGHSESQTCIIFMMEILLKGLLHGRVSTKALKHQRSLILGRNSQTMCITIPLS